jgi:FkbM family methyltransferase
MDYSQGYEQDFLIEYFNDKKTGILVDIGAADGINNSNTRYLIENGWEGLLVEPNKKNYNKLLELYDGNKNITIENCGCSNINVKGAKFFIDKNDEFEQISTFSEENYLFCKDYFKCDYVEDEIDLIKTSDIFKKHNLKNIDFISIDAEGYDSLIINGIDFNEVVIDLFCVENINDDCIDNLVKNGYELIYETSGNKFYKKTI